MKFKLNAMVAAVALLASVGAQAAMDTMASGNGTLALVAYDRTGIATGSFMADLNFNIDAFLPTSTAASNTIVWNFGANTISVNGSALTGLSIAYSTEFSSYASGTQATEMRWAVVGGDGNSQRFVTTGAPTINNLSDTDLSRQTNAATSNMSNMDGLWTSNNQAGTHLTSDIGAKFSTPGDTSTFAPVAGTGKFGTNGNWNGALKWSAGLANTVASKFFLLDNTGTRGDFATPITTYGNPNVSAPSVASANFSTFAFDQNAGTLTWTGVAAPIPEPGTYAMLLAGLAAIGFMARRRSA